MKRGAFLALGALVCALGSVVKLWPLWRDFDTVPVRSEAPARASETAAKLDAVLLRHIRHFSYIGAFDHVLAAGERQVRIEHPVWLDRCEVRQGDFNKFAGWRPFHPQASADAPGQPADWRHFSDTKDHAISGRLDGPASGVAWYDAYAYCEAAGGRLPSAAEWIAAAAGRPQRLYPWGNDFDPAPWPYLDALLNAARPCEQQPQTNTPAGFADMGQNVSEWAVDGDRAAVMGGNAYNAPRELHALAALYRIGPADHRSPYLGFRCAYDEAPGATPWRATPAAAALAAGEYSIGLPAGARIPGLLAALPRDRIDLIARIFEQRQVAANELHLTVREISRREYAAFLRDPFVALGLHAEDGQPADHRHRPPDWDAQMRNPDLPVVNVDWWSAYAFASWAGGRLPSAEEWENAASGQGQRLYPWGDAFDGAAAVTGEQYAGRPQRSTAENGDATPDGVLAMGGNVSEWTRSVSTAAGSYAMIVKGGNYLLPGKATARFDYRNHVPPGYRSPTIGFRVAFDRPR